LTGPAQVLEQETLSQQTRGIVFHTSQHLLHGLGLLGTGLLAGVVRRRTGTGSPLIPQQIRQTGDGS
jgi:hypothetical protein